MQLIQPNIATNLDELNENHNLTATLRVASEDSSLSYVFLKEFANDRTTVTNAIILSFELIEFLHLSIHSDRDMVSLSSQPLPVPKLEPNITTDLGLLGIPLSIDIHATLRPTPAPIGDEQASGYIVLKEYCDGRLTDTLLVSLPVIELLYNSTKN